MWTVFIAMIVYAGVGLLFFLLGQISLQGKIEKETGVAWRNHTQADLLIEISNWKCVWDEHQLQEREAFIHKRRIR